MNLRTRLLATATAAPLIATGLIAIPFAQSASAATTVYSTPGSFTFTKTSGQEVVLMEVIGAGGAGGDSPVSAFAGGNGGSSAVYSGYFDITLFSTVSVLVGTAGGASAATYASNARGLMAGGGGGGGDGGLSGVGGAGGSATDADSSPGDGAIGEGVSPGDGGGGGGGTFPTVTGGSGGSGGGAANSGNAASGFDGGSGGSAVNGGGPGGGGGGGYGGGGGGGGGQTSGGGGGGAGGSMAQFILGASSMAPTPGNPGYGGAGASAGAGDGDQGEDGQVTITALEQPVVSTTAGDGSATVSWTTPTQPVSGVTYELYQDDVLVSGATNGGTITGLTNGTSYLFTVRAVKGTSPAQMKTVSHPSAVTPQIPPIPPVPPVPPVEPVAPKLSKVTIDSPSQVTASVSVTGEGASLSSRTMPTRGEWSTWTPGPAQPSLALPIDVASGSWVELRSKSSDGLTPITVGYVRIVGNPAVRGDIKRKCRATAVTSVAYPTTTSARVGLQAKRTCAKFRISRNDGQTYSKWKPVKSKSLTAKSLTPGTMGRMQIKANKKRTTVWLYAPTERNEV